MGVQCHAPLALRPSGSIRRGLVSNASGTYLALQDLAAVAKKIPMKSEADNV